MMLVFSGSAWFSPSVPVFVKKLWICHGGSIGQQPERFFCCGPADPSLTKFKNIHVVIFHADWIIACIDEMRIVSVVEFVLDKYYEQQDPSVNRCRSKDRRFQVPSPSFGVPQGHSTPKASTSEASRSSRKLSVSFAPSPDKVSSDATVDVSAKDSDQTFDTDETAVELMVNATKFQDMKNLTKLMRTIQPRTVIVQGQTLLVRDLTATVAKKGVGSTKLKPSLPFLWKPYRSASVDDSPPVFKVKDTLQTLSSHPYNANTKFIAFAPNAEYGGKQFTARRVS